MDNENDFNKNATDDMKVIERAAIERFLKSPISTSIDKENVINVDDNELEEEI